MATNFAVESDSWLKYITNNPIGRCFLISPEKGAEQLVRLVQNTGWVSGTYYEKGKPARRNHPQALDADLAVRLWDESERLLGDRLRPA